MSRGYYSRRSRRSKSYDDNGKDDGDYEIIEIDIPPFAGRSYTEWGTFRTTPRTFYPPSSSSPSTPRPYSSSSYSTSSTSFDSDALTLDDFGMREEPSDPDDFAPSATDVEYRGIGRVPGISSIRFAEMDPILSIMANDTPPADDDAFNAITDDYSRGTPRMTESRSISRSRSGSRNRSATRTTSLRSDSGGSKSNSSDDIESIARSDSDTQLEDVVPPLMPLRGKRGRPRDYLLPEDFVSVSRSSPPRKLRKLESIKFSSASSLSSSSSSPPFPEIEMFPPEIIESQLEKPSSGPADFLDVMPERLTVGIPVGLSSSRVKAILKWRWDQYKRAMYK